MAEQLNVSETTPLSSPDLLLSIVEEEGEQRDHGTISFSPIPNIIIEPSADLFTLSSSTSSDSSTMLQVDHQDESMPLLLATSQNSNMEQHDEGREPNPYFNSPRVEHETQPSSSDPILVGTEQQHEHLLSLSPGSGEPSHNTQHSVGDLSASNIVAQQAEIKQQQQAFSLFDPMQSSIMLRRKAPTESASAAPSSPSPKSLKNLNPRRVRQFISTLDIDEDLCETLCKLVIATAPFHKNEPRHTPPAPEEIDRQADTLRHTLGGLVFSPESSTATTTEKGSVTCNSNENPTGNLLFDANAAESLGSRQIEPRSDSPPLLLSTAAVEESLDPNAPEPTHYTIAEFVNIINEKRIQVESVTEDDWLIEEVRVGILNHLMNNPSEEDPTTEGDGDEAVETKEEVDEQIKTQEETSGSDLVAEGRSNKAVMTEEPSPEHTHAKEDTAKSNLTVEDHSDKAAMTEEPSLEQAHAKEDTLNPDVQRWKGQGPDGWLKRDDGSDMNEDELEEECARWDAMVSKARKEKEGEEMLEGTNGGNGNNPMRLESLDLGEKLDSLAARIGTIGQYSPSVYSGPDEAGGSEKAATESTASQDANSGLVREIMGLMDA